MTIALAGRRDCPYGHGALEALDGWWALRSVNLRSAEQSRALGGPHQVTLTINSRYLALKAHRCKECRMVLLFDEEAS